MLESQTQTTRSGSRTRYPYPVYQFCFFASTFSCASHHSADRYGGLCILYIRYGPGPRGPGRNKTQFSSSQNIQPMVTGAFSEDCPVLNQTAHRISEPPAELNSVPLLSVVPSLHQSPPTPIHMSGVVPHTAKVELCDQEQSRNNAMSLLR